MDEARHVAQDISSRQCLVVVMFDVCIGCPSVCLENWILGFELVNYCTGYVTVAVEWLPPLQYLNRYQE
jgi:hypothetical protein